MEELVQGGRELPLAMLDALVALVQRLRLKLELPLLAFVPPQLQLERALVVPQPRDLVLVFLLFGVGYGGRGLSLIGLNRVTVDRLAAVNVLEEVSLPSYELLVCKFPLVRVDLPKPLFVQG